MATISTLGYALLCALHRGPLTGYDLVRKMRRPIGYYWTARQSQIYPELGRLSEAGLIAHESSPGPGPRERKTHRLTDAGRAALAAWLVEPPGDRAPRDEIVLKTYAQAAADLVEMRALYVREAASYQELLDEFTRQRWGRVVAARRPKAATATGFQAGQRAASRADIGRVRLSGVPAIGRGA